MTNKDIEQTLIDIMAAISYLSKMLEMIEEQTPLEFSSPLASGAFQGRQLAFAACLARLQAKENELRGNLRP